MSVSLPNGSVISIAAGYGTAVPMSAVTNASPAVATLEAAHGVTEGDILQVTSGWSRLNDKIVRAGAVATNDVDLEGIDTSNLTRYPSGSGAGTVRPVDQWQQLTQVLNSTSNGGEQQFANYQFLEDSFERQIPTNKSAQSLQLSMADDQTLAWYNILAEADEDKMPRALRIQLPSGAAIFYNTYVSFNKTPTLNINEVMALQATFSLLNEPVRYAS